MSIPRILILSAFLAFLIPAAPSGAATCNYTIDTEPAEYQANCCRDAAVVPLEIGESTFYLSVRRPVELDWMIPSVIDLDQLRADPANPGVPMPNVDHAMSTRVDAQAASYDSLVFLYEETNGIDELQRGGRSGFDRQDLCLDVLAPVRTDALLL